MNAKWTLEAVAEACPGWTLAPHGDELRARLVHPSGATVDLIRGPRVPGRPRRAWICVAGKPGARVRCEHVRPGVAVALAARDMVCVHPDVRVLRAAVWVLARKELTRG